MWVQALTKMRTTYDHALVASFIAWFDYTLSTNGGAFFNTPTLLYPISTDYYSSRQVYSAPFKPWIYDNSISGANIPSGVYDASGNFLTRDSGIYFDFNEGWVVSTGNSLSAPLSGNVAVKEFDIFYTNEDEDYFLAQTKFIRKPRAGNQIANTGLAANERTFPCCSIKYDIGSNKDWAFGGTQNTVSEFRALVVADSTFLIDGILSVFRDTRLSNFSLLDPSALPLNSLGDYKGGVPFNYSSNISTDPENFIFISNVNCMKLSDSAGAKVGQKLFVAMIDFTVERPRNLFLRFNPNNYNYRVTEDINYRITQ